jgi:hypothetical protein
LVGAWDIHHFDRQCFNFKTAYVVACSFGAILDCDGCCAGKFVQPSAQLAAENWKRLKEEKSPTSEGSLSRAGLRLS